MYSDEDSSDTEDEIRNNHYIYLVKYDNTGLHNPIIMPHPSRADLNAIARKILDNISKINNHPGTGHEKNYDCVAVGYTANQEIYVAANVKERYRFVTTGSLRNDRIEYGELGLSEKLIEPIQHALETELNTNNQFKVTVIQQSLDENQQSTPDINARDHAEMQLLSYATEHGEEITRLGISKSACVKCEEQLEDHDIRFHNDEEGNRNPKNWAHPENVKTKKLVTMSKRRILVKYRDVDESEHNIPKTRAEARQEILKNFKQQVIPKPGCHVTVGAILDVIEDIDRQPSANAGVLKAYAGTYKKQRTARVGAYASASVAEAHASASIFGASASFLSASAHVEAGSNYSIGANASLVRAEAHAGPLGVGVGLNLNTGANVGLDGVNASFLGFGVGIGPKMSIKTPVIDVSCNIM
ncbi:unnamed protein product [Rotaria socialis]|uniref:Uncharacterized protein n=1 Tax=Rotaria socialis TaxID=392032 RepID=A0A817T9I5_9BILA|nr:unnamed protein product [Rotaria socialis]CAF3314602.1 unnamed protein product [Rotaria socialis]CAF3524634.1 unnamed protein product [Rotaria socialis]CAF3590146.1 unnamed protein product [Rotaria socialis]CAF4271586.1 unnamed protein product [Rotaria socialis]